MRCLKLQAWILLATSVGVSTGCEDVKGKFLVNNNKRRNCKQIKKKFMAHCDTKAEVRENCPLTCGLCPCEDRGGKFEYNGKRRNCKQIKKKFMGHCVTKVEVQENCPLTCGLCAVQTISPTAKPTISPTSSPSTSPTSTPSTSPTNTPSIFPTNVPTISPTSTPSISPTTKPTNSPTDRPTTTPVLSPPTLSTCRLDAILTFPYNIDSEEYYGYHNDFVTIVKEGNDSGCSYYNQETDWGCTHAGDAYIYYFPTVGKLITNETVSITDVSDDTFYFYIDHSFNYYETYYEGDSVLVAGLYITIENSTYGPFYHDTNDGVNTHDEQNWINPEYKGSTLVTVACDNECNCEVEQSEPACEIAAVLTFPSLDEAGLYGYHSDFLTVTKDEEEEMCDYYAAGETEWGCLHDGNYARFDSYYNSTFAGTSQSESVTIRNGSNAQFNFRINHAFTEQDSVEEFTELDHLIVGTMHLIINGEHRGEYKHDADAETNTHIDGDINPLYPAYKDVVVTCDVACNCMIS